MVSQYLEQWKDAIGCNQSLFLLAGSLQLPLASFNSPNKLTSRLTICSQ